MPTRSFSETASTHVSPASRDRAVRRTVAAAEAMHKEFAVENDVPVLVEKRPALDRNPNAAGNWVYDNDRGKYLNTFTGELADEPDTDIPGAGTLVVSDEEEAGFTVSDTQYSAGIRLAVSAKSGLVRRCPNCGKRRLLIVPKDGHKFLVCADALNEGDGCDFYRKM